MNIMIKIECLIVGWKPDILRNCREVSYAMLKKYVSAIIILSILWGIIGWCVADNYLGIKTLYGKSITSAIFIAMIVCIERYIILTHGDLKTVIFFRTFLAILMAVIGSTVFDQIMFQNDISVTMKNVRTDQINAEIPNRTMLIDNEIRSLSHIIDSIGNENRILYDAINKQPTVRISEVSTTTRQTGVDEKGKPLTQQDRTVTQKNVPNPKTEQVQKNEELLKEYRTRERELQTRKLNITTEVSDEYEKARTGFLEELSALYSLLGNNRVIRIFYIIMFLFLTCLELLVVTTKGSRKCDYELLLEFQLKQREKELKALDNQ